MFDFPLREQGSGGDTGEGRRRTFTFTWKRLKDCVEDRMQLETFGGLSLIQN